MKKKKKKKKKRRKNEKKISQHAYNIMRERESEIL